MKFPQVNFIII